MTLISLLVYVIVLGLVFYLLYWLIGQIPLPEPFRVVATVLLALAAVVMLLGVVFGGVSLPAIRIAG
jgi:hypothetical protein